MGSKGSKAPSSEGFFSAISWIVIPLVIGLIWIGDIVRYGLWFLIHTILLVLRYIANYFTGLTHAFSRLSQSTRLALKHARATIPKRSFPQLPRPGVFKTTTLPNVTFFIPFMQRVWVWWNQTGRPFVLGILITILLVVIPYTAYLWLTLLPNPHLLSRRDLEVTTKLFDRNNVLLYEIYADQNRTPIELSDIPQHAIDATIAIEDKHFYNHQGFSLAGILRAARENILHRNIQGGSTITQQLIKSALLTPEITVSRKLKEIFLAFWAERIYTKQEILEMYFNQVPYGGTAWGIEAASQTYFRKSVTQLTLAESALLAGLPQAPTNFSPFGPNPKLATERQKEVLRRMVEDRYITKEQAEEAENQKLVFAQPNTAIRAPHFVMYVKNLLEGLYGTRLVERGGLRITTSLDLSVQEKSEEILTKHLDKLQSLQVGNGGILVTKPETGEILAMVGSKNYFDVGREGNVNVTTALRPPGSSIKVVTYAAALEKGITAATLIEDAPIVYTSAGSPPYAPVNYDSKFHGYVSFRNALGNSYNIPAVKLLNAIGVNTMIDMGKSMGIDTWEEEGRYGLALTLGGGEVRMTDMAEVYGTLATGGNRVDLMPILEVSDYAGHPITSFHPKITKGVLSREASWIMTHILSDNTARMTAFGPNSSLVIPGHTVSVKTGTSNDKRDNWTIGYTPSFVVTVWVGNNDNSPMNPYLTSGVTGAAPIWHDVMTELTKDTADEPFIKPDDLVELPCYFGRTEYFIKGTEPKSGRCGSIPTPSPSPSQ